MKVSKTGYKKTSGVKNEKSLIVPSGQITMTENDGKPLEKGPILGIDNLGNMTIMEPGLDYSFPGSYVYEIPMANAKNGGYILPGRYRNPEGNWLNKYAGGGDISIPDLSRPKWLDKYQTRGEVRTSVDPETGVVTNINITDEPPFQWTPLEDQYGIKPSAQKRTDYVPYKDVSGAPYEIQDPYAHNYSTVDVPKNLSELPSYRLYTMGKGSFKPFSGDWTTGLNLNDAGYVKFDEKTGYNYQPSRQNLQDFQSLPMEGEKEFNLRRFVLNPYEGQPQTHDAYVKNDGTVDKENFIPTSYSREETMDNVFKDLYAQNLYKFKGDRDAAYNATSEFMTERVEPQYRGKYYEYINNPNVSERDKLNINLVGSHMTVDPKETEDSVRQMINAKLAEEHPEYLTNEDLDFDKATKSDPRYREKLNEYNEVLQDWYVTNKNMSPEEAKALVEKDLYKNVPKRKTTYATFKDGGRLQKYQGDTGPSQVDIVSQQNKYFNEGLDFVRDWMDSPMYNQMVLNSVKGNQAEADYIKRLRKENLETMPSEPNVVFSDRPDKKSVWAHSKADTGLVEVFPKGFNAGPTIYVHEGLHSTDRPRGKFDIESYDTGKNIDYYNKGNIQLGENWYENQEGNVVAYPDWMRVDDPRFPEDPVWSNRVIPQSDVKYITTNRAANWKDNQKYIDDISKYQVPSNLEIRNEVLENNSDITADSPEFAELFKKVKKRYEEEAKDYISGDESRWLKRSHEYIDKPTEVRARLGEIRYDAQQKGIYNPFTEQVTPQIFEKLKNNNRAINDLRSQFTDEEILWMLQNISYNDEVNADAIPTGKYGGRLEKYQSKGQVKYTTDPIKIQNYNDSLTVYNAFKNDRSILDSFNTFKEVEDFVFDRIKKHPEISKALVRLKNRPEGYENIGRSYTKEFPVNGGSAAMVVEKFAKPKQPYKKYDPKEYIPTKTPKLEIEPIQLIIPQSDRTLMPYNNTLDILRAKQKEDKSDKNLYPARVVPAPDFRHGGWLDKYQGDEGSSQVERRDPNQLFFPSSTEASTYESQYSLPEVSVAPNWTEAELERNRLRDEYIKKDKNVFRHWYDKLGYDKDNVTKRANQFAYNKLAKQYLKGDKDQLTEEQRKFIEKSEYANRLQPSIGSRFVEGVTNPGFNLETLGNLSAPFEYPANLLRGAIKGEFTDALMGQTPSPYFVSSDLAGTSPTEAAIMSGLVDAGVDVGIGAVTPTKLPGSPGSMGPGPMMLGLPNYSHEVKNVDYFKKMLDSYGSNKLSNQSKKYFEGIINSVRKQDGMATKKQYDMLQRLRTGDFNYGKRGAVDSGPDDIDWLQEEIRFSTLPELNNPQASEVLDNFMTRINTPEGKRRLKELGITEKYVFDKLKIVGDENTLGHYWLNKIGLHPDLPEFKNVTRHEIEHAVQDAYNRSRLNEAFKFKWTDLLGKTKKSERLSEASKKITTDIDESLKGLELRRTPQEVDWNAIKTNDPKKDPSQLFNYISDKQRATNYFASGSGGKEKSPFLAEVQQYMMDQGILPKTSYAEVTPEMVKNTFTDALFDETGGGKYLRLFQIMKPTEANYKLIADNLNKMLGVAPVIGLGTVGALQKEKDGGVSQVEPDGREMSEDLRRIWNLGQPSFTRPSSYDEYTPKFGWSRGNMTPEERAYEQEYLRQKYFPMPGSQKDFYGLQVINDLSNLLFGKQKKSGGESQGEGYYDYLRHKGSNAYSIFAKGGAKGWLDNYK